MEQVMVVGTARTTENDTEMRPEPVVSPRVLTDSGRPDPQWVRGRCPECGDDLVSNLYYIGGRGYLIRWECWGSLGDSPKCDYSKVL